MDRETITIPFEEWVKFILRHAGWEWDGDSWDEPSPSEHIAYITRLFENAREAMASYSDDQVAEGLRDLSYVEENIIILLDESVSLLDQIRCIQSMYALFEQVFVPRCSPLLFHLGEGEANSLNDACYM